VTNDPERVFRDLIAHPDKIPSFAKMELEGDQLDYKNWAALKSGQKEGFERLVHCIISFSHKPKGGLIIIGVNDETREVLRHTFNQEEISRLYSALNDEIEPPLKKYKLEKVSVPGFEEVMLLLVVPDGLTRRACHDKHIYVRHGDRSEPAYPHELVLKDFSSYADGLSNSPDPQKREIARKLTKNKFAEAARLAAIVHHSTALEHIALLNTKAVALAIEEWLQEALPLFENALKIAQSCSNNEAIAIAAFNCGITLHKICRLEEAVSYYDCAIAVDRKFAGAYNNRGAALAQKGDLNGAIADFTKAIEINPKDATAYNNRGNVHTEKGDLNSAIADFDKAIQINPKHPHAYNNRGAARSNKGDFAGAIADYDRAIKINPKDAEAYNNRGAARSNKGDFTDAIADYNEAIEINPNLAGAYSNRGIARSDKGDVDGAIADYDKAIEINPSLAVAYFNRGLARYKKGDLDSAIADYNKAIEVNPKDAEACNGRGTCRAQKGDLDGAIADFDKAIEINPKDAKVYFNRGVTRYRKMKIDLQGALSDFQRFLRLAPNHPLATAVKLSIAYLKQKLNK
jgi:tetratricopeptide (TPR) repeat protein